MKLGSIALATTTGLTLVLAPGIAANAAEIKIIAGAGISSVLDELGPQFERATGHRLVIKYGVTGAMTQQIEAGEAFDLAVVPVQVIEALTKQGKFAAETPTQVARVGMGVAVRAGAPKFDISSVDAFKRAMLKAES